MNRTYLLFVILFVLAACGGAPASPGDTANEMDTTEAEAPAVEDAEAATEEVAESVDNETTTEASNVGPSIAADLPPVEPNLSTFPVTIENCERTLTFEQPPERVIGLWQPPNEMLLALGLEDRIVALAGNYTDLPSDLAAASSDIPTIGTSMAWPSREVLLSETPDLVVSEGLEGFAFDTAQGYASVEQIEETGAQVLSTGGSCNPLEGFNREIDVVYDDLRTLGMIFGVSERADALIETLQDKQNDVADRVADREPVPTVFYNGGEGPLNVLSSGVWGDAITQAGGTVVFEEDVFQVSAEEFAAAPTEVILVGYFPGQDPNELITYLKETFPNLPAVQNDHLYPVATIDTEASIRIMDGLETIARAIHPEAFE